MTRVRILILNVLFFCVWYQITANNWGINEGRSYNGIYTNDYLNQVAFPIGGIGAGMFCLEGTGAISHVSLENHPDMTNEPYAFAALYVEGYRYGAKVLEGQVPKWKIFNAPESALGRGDKTYGLPRFRKTTFHARFPFGFVNLSDPEFPIEVRISGWSPFIPTDADNSSLPCGALEYEFTNTTSSEKKTIFSFNSKNFIDVKGQIHDVKNGFILGKKESSKGLAIFVDNESSTVDYCWFRGGWFDSQTILWNNISQGHIVQNNPINESSPGASIYVPLVLQPGEKKTIRVHFCWYLPDSDLSIGFPQKTGAAFETGLSKGTAPHQQQVSGFAGTKLLNSFDRDGDGLIGILQSDTLPITRKYMKLLVGGGILSEHIGVNLMVDGKIIKKAGGNRSEALQEICWDLSDYIGKQANLKVVDLDINPWGHILLDQIILTDNASEDIYHPSRSAIVIEDFEGFALKKWNKINTDSIEKTLFPSHAKSTYVPWYSSRFSDIRDVVAFWTDNYEILKQNSSLFRDTFYDSTLPPEVIEAVAANLTILKSPTVLRQTDGRFWAWEGCQDQWGSCPGSCTHVWNYAQALPHLFPSLERSLRQTEFQVAQNNEGHQTFRVNMPISTPPHDFHAAADGQLGGIMKVYREWRISGDTEWMKRLYPLVKTSLDYCIRTWDPDSKGYLYKPHHNTYDIEFWGADGMCNSFYIGALNALVQMGNFLGKDVKKYKLLMDKGKKFMETQLYNGEYFIQRITSDDWVNTSPEQIMSYGGAYSEEARKLFLKEGPKYQYGTGCLSDGILGMWISSVCGLNEVIDSKKVQSHLQSVYKYNFRNNLVTHFNTQRPTYGLGDEGGLLLCSWPKGGMPALPFVYSNEVWTGIEYQVASHLMMKGEVQKGLDIVRKCRDRYDGRTRNPFDEFECGHWYARALSSYGLLQGLTGIRYDAIDKVLYIQSKIGDFRCFISTNTGFGMVELKDGKPHLDVKYGTIEVDRFNLDGQYYKR